jgi:hypothetical protein
MSKITFLSAVLLLLTFHVASGQDYSVEKIEAAPEAEGVSEEIAELISDQGIRVKKGSSRTVCELWFCKDLPIEADFKPTEERLYPFTSGQLIGLVHFGRRGSEFRDQTVSKGWYTLRFGLQPVDGNHEGTSPTRDFLLLVDPAEDELAEPWSEQELHEASANAAGSSHPALMCLQRPAEGSDEEIRHDESNDWWVMHLVANGVANEKSQAVPMDLVVIGHATE